LRTGHLIPAAYLGVLGPTGLSAHFGTLDVGRLNEGETVLVSWGGGGVGTFPAGGVAIGVGKLAVAQPVPEGEAARLILGQAGSSTAARNVADDKRRPPTIGGMPRPAPG